MPPHREAFWEAGRVLHTVGLHHYCPVWWYFIEHKSKLPDYQWTGRFSWTQGFIFSAKGIKKEPWGLPRISLSTASFWTTSALPWMKIFSKYFSIMKRKYPQCLWSRFTQDGWWHFHVHVKLDHKGSGVKREDPACYDWKQMPSSESEVKILKWNITLRYS